jgi:hypothetical protein
MPRIPNWNQFSKVIDGSDELPLVIRSHQLIESALNGLITESLPFSHSLEVRRLSFLLKVDMAIALGLLTPIFRGGYSKFNEIRNRFAHEAIANLDSKRCKDLFNALAPVLQSFGKPWDEYSDELTAFRHCAAVLFTVLEEKFLYQTALAEEEKEFFEARKEAIEKAKAQGLFSKQVEARFRKLKQQWLESNEKEFP